MFTWLRNAALAGLFVGASCLAATAQDKTAPSAESAPQAAAGAARVVDATVPEDLAQIIRDLGYAATLDTDSAGDPMIRTKVGGSNSTIYFYRCRENANCRLLIFTSAFDLTDDVEVDLINAWNAKALVGRAYVDDDKDAVIEMSLNMDGGVTEENFRDSFDWWDVIVGDFKKHINF